MRRTLVLCAPLCAAVMLSAAAQTAPRQTGMSMRERQAMLDSLRNPPVAEGAGAMLFESRSIDAGEMNEDDAPRGYTFRWRNAGEQPLVVTRVRTTCGCAKPEYDRTPVKAGESARIGVTYYPKGHPGAFERRIFVYTQLSDSRPTATLTLTGRVTPSLSPVADYPHRMGALLLKRTQVSLSGTERQEERIACMNGGERELEVAVVRELLPDWLSAELEPSRVAPGGKCDLVVRFDPSKATTALPARLPIVLGGIDLPPGRRTVTVLFENEKR